MQNLSLCCCAPRPALLATILAALLLGVSPVPSRARAAAGRARATRQALPFAAKAGALRAPQRAPQQPSPLRRVVLPKGAVRLQPDTGQRRDRLVVKFAEGYRVRLRGGELVELDGRPLPGVAAAARQPGATHITRLFARPEADLERDRAFAMRRSGAALADLDNYVLVHLDPRRADPAAIAAAWLALEVVETVYFEGFATEACTDIAPPTPDFVANQNYLEPAPTGVDAFAAWTFHPAGHGDPGFWFIDLERGWNVDHEDFGDVAILNGAPLPGSIDHGTAVLGEVVGCDTGFGVSGIANGITARMVNWGNEPSIAAAFDLAASLLDPGEIYLIEIHTSGPGPIPGEVCQCNCSQFGYVPMEWEQANFDAIQLHTAAGIVVVEAGGNGGMNLDHPFYNGLFDRGVRDSGAILVGAGTPGQHAPECWTNYGSRIDCQGYGSSVASTGYGNLFDPGDANQWYTGTFSGTSSASPIVTGCAAVVQNLAQQGYGLTLDPFTVRGMLALYGTPQGAPLEKPIGVLPDLGAIVDTWYRPLIEHTPLPDTQNEIDPYEVVAVVTPAILNGSIVAVSVHYGVSGPPDRTVAMSPSGAPHTWHGFIPAQDAGNYVLYDLEATPAAGEPVFFPAGGDSMPLLFVVGSMQPVVTDDLETPSAWTVGAPGDDASAGIWERGDPFATFLGSAMVAPEDDHTTAPGVFAYVTGNPGPGAAATEGDVDDGKTTLFSPLFDLTAERYVRISAWVWTRFLFDDLFGIAVSNDGGQSWLELGALDDDLEEWHAVEYELRREVLPYTTAMQLRFVASDYGVPTVVECGVDDLVIRGLAQQSQGVVGEGTAAAAAPLRLRLGPAAPNPFLPRRGPAVARFGYTLPVAGPVRLGVYDVGGRLLRLLVAGERPAGKHVARWDGRATARGARPAAPGVYFLRLEAGGAVRVQRLVLLR